MDIVMAYTDDSGSKASVRHQYVSGDLSSNQRTVSGISPNNFGVNVWDPDETATIKSRLLPLPKPNSFGTVLVAAPQGATDSSYVYFAINDCRFLHNNHTPPTGDTARQPDLPMDDTLPTAATLHNYDQDADANPGCTINKGAVRPGETDIAKYQDWRTGVLSSPLSLTGTIAVDLWAALQQYALDKAGVVTIYFRDYDGSSHTEIGQGTIFDVDWQGGTSNFVRKVILIPGFNYTVPAGNELEVKLVVGNVSASEMWFAYDTQAYQSLINLSYIAPTYTTFYHLHNDPTPPTGNTAAQAVLPMSTTAPTATTLYNYDTNYDTNAGRVLQKTPQGLNETVLQKH